MLRWGLVLMLVVAGTALASTARERPALAISCGDFADSEPSWAPTGRTLTFTRATASGEFSSVIRIDRNGRHVRRVSNPLDYAYGAEWSPDASHIAYNTFDQAAVVDIVVARADGTQPRVLSSFQWQREPPTTYLRWSPSGNELAYVGLGLHVARADGSGVRLVARDGTQPAWAPDGKRLAYVTNAGIAVSGRVIANGAFPAWSPDGNSLAYESLAGVGVHVIGADGSNHRIVDPLGSVPVWAADGTRLVDVAMPTRGARPRLHVVDLRRARVRTVTHDGARVTGADSLQPRFSPDGKTIAFTSVRGAPGGSEIRFVRADGRNERRLTYHCVTGDEGLVTGSRIYGTWLPDLLVGGADRDRIYGYGGDDTIRARDGARDVIACGRGKDLVTADKRDVIAKDCEVVRRR